MHPTGGDECAEAIAAIENATADKRTVPSLGEGSPELVAYKPGDDHANVLCRGQVIAVIPVDEATAAASLRVAMASASGQVAVP